MPTFAIPNNKTGVIAQLVEQRTENPCVPGSIPGDTTKKPQKNHFFCGFFVVSPDFCITICITVLQLPAILFSNLILLVIAKSAFYALPFHF